MDKQKFNKLDAFKQLEYVNAQLSNGISLRSISSELGMSKTTIRDRLEKIGHYFNAEARQYIKSDTFVDTSITIKPKKDTKEKIIQKDNKSITNKVAVASAEPQREVTELEQFHELNESLKDIKELLGMKEQLKELIQNYNKSINIIDVPIHELKIDKDKFDGDPEGRLIKVYGNVNKKWKEFCNKNSQFKMQDLYSLALLEFMERYDK